MKKIPKPKYKIGDVVVYPDRYEEKKNTMLTFYQSVIVESDCLWETGDSEDKPSWYYHTTHTLKELEDSLTNHDILYKL